MPQKYVVCNPDICLGCGICEFVCSAVKGKSLDPSFSRIRQVNFEPTGSMAIACLLCENPPCVTACPMDALVQEENGVIRVDERKCNACGWCILACRFGAIMLHPTERVAMTCDLCDGDPECIKLCPFEGAIIFSTMEEEADKSRKRPVSNILLELAKARGGSSNRS
jgi:Fe-S-cluster-containing dehydrogenase component